MHSKSPLSPRERLVIDYLYLCTTDQAVFTIFKALNKQRNISMAELNAVMKKLVEDRVVDTVGRQCGGFNYTLNYDSQTFKLYEQSRLHYTRGLHGSIFNIRLMVAAAMGLLLLFIVMKVFS